MFASNIVNRKGQPFTRMSISRAAWLYAAENPEESFKYLKTSPSFYAEKITYDQWLDDLAFHASVNLPSFGFQRLAARHPLCNYLNRALKVRKAKYAEQRSAEAIQEQMPKL
jgi:hypothetical protein